MRRLALSLVLILLAVALPWFWRHRSAPPQAPDHPSSRQSVEPSGHGQTRSSAFPPSELGRLPLSADPVQVVADASARAGVLAGEVLSALTNEPVAGAELTFARGERVSSVMTNSAGFFSYEASQPGQHHLVSVTADGFFPFAPQWGHSPLRLTAQPDRRIDNAVVYLDPATTWRGTVVAPSGQGVAQATVSLFSPGQDASSLLGLPHQVVADEQGNFSVQAPWGTLLEAHHQGFRATRLRLSRRLTPDRPLLLRLRVGQEPDQPQATIAGRVVDEQGFPLQDAVVSARLLARRGQPPAPAQAVTDDQGQFLLEALLPGPYQLVARAPGWQPARTPPIRAGADNVELTLRQGATLRGGVTDAATGRPVPGFSVIIERPHGALRRLPYSSETFFDPQGRFEVTGLESARYLVTVRAQGYPPSDPQEVSLQGNETGQLYVSLSRGGQATGTVVDAATGQPIARAQVVLEGPVGNPGLPVALSARTVTDQGGEFRISGLAPGRRSLFVQAEGYHQQILSGLAVGDHEALPDLVVELHAQGPEEDRQLELVGIGAVLAPSDEALIIIRVLHESGASAAGLAVGDAILRVDGRPVTELGFAGAVEQIRGEEGTLVRLGVRRRLDGSQQEIAVPRLRVRG